MKSNRNQQVVRLIKIVNSFITILAFMLIYTDLISYLGIIGKDTFVLIDRKCKVLLVHAIIQPVLIIALVKTLKLR